MSFKIFCCLELKFKKIFTCDHFSESYKGFKMANLEQLIKAIYFVLLTRKLRFNCLNSICNNFLTALWCI